MVHPHCSWRVRSCHWEGIAELQLPLSQSIPPGGVDAGVGCWPGCGQGCACKAVTHPSPRLRQAILRDGLVDVKQFFSANGSCRLPLSPSLLVKGIVPRVSEPG